MANWNPWHGCTKLSAGCLNCYVYRGDERYGREHSDQPHKNGEFDLPLRKKRDGSWLIPSGELVYTCFTSDFLLDAADQWREEAWEMMRQRSDLRFLFITKRIDRFARCLPRDWGDGWNNVIICCTVENQDRTDYRLPIFLEAPIKHRHIVCEPLLERIELRRYLGGWIEGLVAGGESGQNARVCDYSWILDLREQCIERGVPFRFKQTGARFRKEGRLYHIERRLQHSQARKANINTGEDMM
ncbi:MAG: DUF5131 family protein [Ruminococcaceae bacterium]|nr:DUF5131 family protein [Oscillospiraceae bacterium]